MFKSSRQKRKNMFVAFIFITSVQADKIKISVHLAIEIEQIQFSLIIENDLFEQWASGIHRNILKRIYISLREGALKKEIIFLRFSALRALLRHRRVKW